MPLVSAQKHFNVCLQYPAFSGLSGLDRVQIEVFGFPAGSALQQVFLLQVSSRGVLKFAERFLLPQRYTTIVLNSAEAATTPFEDQTLQQLRVLCVQNVLNLG